MTFNMFTMKIFCLHPKGTRVADGRKSPLNKSLNDLEKISVIILTDIAIDSRGNDHFCIILIYKHKNDCSVIFATFEENRICRPRHLCSTTTLIFRQYFDVPYCAAIL